MRILNSLIVPKYLRGETRWNFWHFSLLQNFKKNLKVGPFEGKKIKKVAQCRKKLKEGISSVFANARKSFWLKQVLEPVTARLNKNREKSVLKSDTFTMRSVV